MFKFLKISHKIKTNVVISIKKLGNITKLILTMIVTNVLLLLPCLNVLFVEKENHIACMRKHLTQDMTSHVQLKH